MSEKKLQPLYLHDCQKCQFLGFYGRDDLYYCPSLRGGSIIARHGNGGPNYSSLAIQILIYAGLDIDSSLLEGLRRQIKRWQEREED